MEATHKTFGSSRVTIKALCACVVGLLVALAAYYYVCAVENGSFFDWIFKGGFKDKRFLVLLILLSCSISVSLCLRGRTIGRFAFRYRWIIAGVLFAFCVMLEVSGSSIGILTSLLGGDDSVLLGSSRQIRSDEYMVYTPMSLSQCTTDGGVFSYFQDSMRATETDMFCVYGQPVWDIAEIFRPFHWGYLLFGAAKGLAFFWCGRFIALFMVSFEFAYRLLARKSLLISLSYACLVSLAGAVQWWFAINSLVEMLIFGQLALIWASLFLEADTVRERLLYSLGIAWCLGIYVLAFYPAWQISFAYVFLAVLVGIFMKQLPRSNVGLRDLGFVFLIVAIVVALVLYVFLCKSWDTVQIVFNTAYPGHRNSNGGGGLYSLFLYPFYLLAPFDPDSIVPNACEASSFFTLFPLSLILPVFLLFKRRKADVLVICLVAVFLFLEAYSIIGLPDFVSQISLLSKTTPNRAVIASEFSLVILLFYSLPYVKGLSAQEAVAIAGVSFVVFMLGFMHFAGGMSFVRFFGLSLTVVAISVLIVSAKNRRMRVLVCGVLIVMAVIGGSLVNPVSIGIEGYFDNEVSEAIQRESGSGDVWAITDAPIQINNVPASLGHKTLNSTNVYPQLETWRKIDPDGEYENVYNRYAHISIELSDDSEVVFALDAPDHMTLRVTVDDLKELGVTKVLSAKRYSGYDGIELIDTVGGYSIYGVA